jgi:hypothetical protein
MKLPIQAVPVKRVASASAIDQGIVASGIACTICKTACSALAPVPQSLCIAACNATVC